MILFNEFKRQYSLIKEEVNEAIKRVLESGWYILGKEGEAFEKEFSDYLSIGYCVGVANGTEAIALSLMAVGVEHGDEVITTNMTAFPTITAIMQIGAIPVVVDVNSNDALIDVSKIEEKITSKTKAIMPVHLYGQSCDIDAIQEICQNNNISLVEDCAQAVGTSYRGKKVGTYGKCSAFSFYPTKNLGAYGDAGAIATNDKSIYDKLLKLRNYGQSRRYYHDDAGINSRLDELQAAILRVKLKYIDQWNDRRREIADYYINNIKTVECMQEHSYGCSNYHLFVVKSDKREELLSYLNENGVNALIHYPVPINKQNAFIGQKDEEFLNAENLANCILSLPMYPDLLDEEVKRVVDVINKF